MRVALRIIVTLAIAGQAALSVTTSDAPALTAIAPSAGNTAGGTPFTVTGTGFLGGATVKLGNVSSAGADRT